MPRVACLVLVMAEKFRWMTVTTKNGKFITQRFKCKYTDFAKEGSSQMYKKCKSEFMT